CVLLSAGLGRSGPV
ncbi:hypothetical protein CP02DC18_1281B, partial [Chlamydia psittaci 02DC18]